MKNPISEENSRKIVNLSFLCAALVCAGHCVWPTQTAFGRVVAYMFRGLLCEVTIPFFFLVSGYFLARHFDEPGWWGRAVRKRIWTIAIPYCVWQFVNAFVWLAISGRWPLRPGGFGLNPFIPPQLVPLWYLRALMIFVVLGPLFAWVLKRWGRGFLAAAFAANLVVGAFVAQGKIPELSRVGGIVFYTFPVRGIFYFSLGAWLAMHPTPLSRRAGNLCGALALGFTAIRLVILHFHWAVPFDFGVLVLPTLLAFLWMHAPAFRLPSVFAQSIFPVYLMHVIVYAVLRQLLVFPSGTLGAFSELALGFGISVAISALLHRFCPRVARLAFGGR